jgi:tetratricopeptide (TPR) repeat protein
MTPERHAQIQRIFEAAADLSGAERNAYLELACGGDADLRERVGNLLAADERESAADPLASTESGDLPIFQLGRKIADRLGRYRLLQKIGEGGMGEVWLAEQKEPVRRRVALKLIKAGMNTREVMARFESERQVLALMDHPAIAKVFDAGTTPDGAPYFVMEYVAGVPITTYCDNHRLSTHERLELFVRVCEGVQHAHQKAIIHRDLKPSNILVTELDGRAAPKIIDFGVAKALSQKLTAETMFTRVGAIVGTPEYASPEQANSSGEDIDTRTDVYSLGVIFYELLAGAPPIDLRKIAFDELLRRLREEEPSKPSAKIRTQDPATSTEVARKRQTEPLTLARQMRGELDSIALKALEKDRSRRYGSPSDFAADIGRYLNNEAVLAVPPSAAYRARKFARHYRAALATACAFALVLIVAAAVSIWQSVRATKQRDRADREAAAAQAVNDFLQNDLLAQASAASQSGPDAKPDPDLKVRTALDRAAARITGKFDRQPEVEASIRDTIGQTYTDLGLYPEARTQLERALDLHRRALGAQNPKALKTTGRLGSIALLQGKSAQAAALFSQTLETQRRVLGPQHPDTLHSMNGLANAYSAQGKQAQAEALYRQTLEIRRRVLGPEHPDTLDSMDNLANVYFFQGKFAQAGALYGQILEISRRVLGPEHPQTLNFMYNLANAYKAQGRYAQAEALFRQTLEILRRVLGPEHPDTVDSMGTLADVYAYQGKSAQAEALYNQTLEIQRRVLGPEHPGTLWYMNSLASVYADQGRYAQAEALYSQTLEIRRRVLGPEHFQTLYSMSGLASVYADRGRYAQAEALYSQVLEIGRRVLGPEHPRTLGALSDFAWMYQRQGKYALAETYAAQALAGRQHALGSEDTDTMGSEADLALANLSQGKFAESEPLARGAVEVFQKKQPDDWQRFLAESLLGASLAGQKKYAEAEPLLLEGYQGMLERKHLIDVPDWYYLDRAHEWLVQLYRAWGSRGRPPSGRKSEIEEKGGNPLPSRSVETGTLCGKGRLALWSRGPAPATFRSASIPFRSPVPAGPFGQRLRLDPLPLLLRPRRRLLRGSYAAGD